MLRTASSVVNSQQLLLHSSLETSSLVVTHNNNIRVERTYTLNHTITYSYNFLERHPGFLNSTRSESATSILTDSPNNVPVNTRTLGDIIRILVYSLK